jgi:hypothetical protein
MGKAAHQSSAMPPLNQISDIDRHLQDRADTYAFFPRAGRQQQAVTSYFRNSHLIV